MTGIKASLDRIRKTISTLEAQVASLRTTERELEALAQKPAREAAPRTRGAAAAPAARGRAAPAAALAAPASQTGSTLTGAIVEALDWSEALSVPTIAERLAAAGRKGETRPISFALQALKKKGLAKRNAKGWLRAGRKPRVKAEPAAAPAEAPKEASRSAPAPRDKGGKQTVAETVAEILQRSGPLALADLAEAVKATGREVSGGTLSTTLQNLKRKGAVRNEDGKWAA